MRVTYTLSNVSNSAAYGVEWVIDGARMQLTCARGGEGLTLAIQTHAGSEWLVSEVESPERFGAPVTGPRELRHVAARLIEAAEVEAYGG